MFYLMCVLSHVQLFSTPWSVAWQATLFVEFSRQEYWSCHFFFHGPPGSGIKHVPPALAERFCTTVPVTWESHVIPLLLFCHLVMSNSLRTHGLQHAGCPCPSLSPWVCLKLTFVESMIPFNHLILLPPSPPALNLSQHQGLFPMCQLFEPGGQSIGVKILCRMG